MLERRKIKDNEIVLDAGCGTGRVTKIIANKVRKGKLYAVDADGNMITNAKKNLKDYSNTVFIKSDLSDLELPEKVDLIFSNAVVHWILDHKKLFTKFWELLKQDGELLIQCGGKGNLGSTHVILEEIRKSKRFKKYFEYWKNPWNFATPKDIIKILNSVGFKDVQAFLTKSTANFENCQEYILFMKTVVMKPYLQYLPDNNSNQGETKNSFVGTFLEKLKEQSIKKKTNADLLKIDYVRLNITGRKMT